MVESMRKKKQERIKKKQVLRHKPKWYMIRSVFWMILGALCFVMFMIGWVVGLNM